MIVESFSLCNISGSVLKVFIRNVAFTIICIDCLFSINTCKYLKLWYLFRKVGWLLKSCKSSRAIIVAPGHRVSFESSRSIAKACIRNHKLPEPARLAHEYVNGIKKKETSLLS
ncbi:MAG: endonuclease V [Candidatus Methanoperedens sp.]|nr:endonuclease V [Candidatus Methanoperedens sp.]